MTAPRGNVKELLARAEWVDDQSVARDCPEQNRKHIESRTEICMRPLNETAFAPFGPILHVSNQVVARKRRFVLDRNHPIEKAKRTLRRMVDAELNEKVTLGFRGSQLAISVPVHVRWWSRFAFILG